MTPTRHPSRLAATPSVERWFGSLLLLTLGHLLTVWMLAIWVIRHYPDAGETHVHWRPDRPRLPRTGRRPRGSDLTTASNNRFRNVMRARGRVSLECGRQSPLGPCGADGPRECDCGRAACRVDRRCSSDQPRDGRQALSGHPPPPLWPASAHPPATAKTGPLPTSAARLARGFGADLRAALRPPHPSRNSAHLGSLFNPVLGTGGGRVAVQRVALLVEALRPAMRDRHRRSPWGGPPDRDRCNGVTADRHLEQRHDA